MPLDFFVTLSHEFTSFSASLTFPPDRVTIARVEGQVPLGLSRIDNESGTLGLLSYHATRRIGQENEEVHVATVYVDVNEDPGTGEILLRFEEANNFLEWVGIRHRQGITDEELPILSEVTPMQTRVRSSCHSADGGNRAWRRESGSCARPQ